MLSKGILSRVVVSRFASLSVSASSRRLPTEAAAVVTQIRCLSGGDKDGDDEDGKKSQEDPFGVHYEDGDENLGPPSELPPKYVRDRATGKFMGTVEEELSARQLRLLKGDTVDVESVEHEEWKEQWMAATDEVGDSALQAEAADRIREEEMAFNTLGRSARAQSVRGIDADGNDTYQDETGFSKPLSPAEFRTFKGFMKDEYKVDVKAGDIPVERTKERVPGYDEKGSFSDNPDLDVAWMTAASRKQMDGDLADDPFMDVMPSDFTPARRVNRLRAKTIPQQLLHHNNLGLLRRYITPSGTIMNRVQSRLGAKDQRKIAKLIKRARNLGLIPHIGQFKVENNGNIHEKDIREERTWEQELINRGLVKRRFLKTQEDTDDSW